ncbi:MAG TPA: glutamate-5-semialdehyde dehydrogenase [Vicinamibacterales bacterium]|jgi:glutamate-5-semialdehyde dehydrogenase
MSVAVPAGIEQALRSLRSAARSLRRMSAEEKRTILVTLADAIVHASAPIIEANAADLSALPPEASPAFRDRLRLDERRVEAAVEGMRQAANLPDPVGEVVESRVLANGLRITRVRAPLGVILLIFESRPNVILEAFSLAFKSGNAIALRGGSESKQTSHAIYGVMRETLSRCGVNEAPFYGIDTYDRALVEAVLARNDLIDIVVPRGGARLIEFVERTARMPIIKNDRGLCHTYVDDEADLAMAVAIVANAKIQRPGVCNALETVLVHRAIAETFLPALHAATAPAKLAWHCDPASARILAGRAGVQAAAPEDWDTEYLDLVMNCRVVSDLEEALAHIERHGSKHSEAIVTGSEARARRFQDEVDAAAVYWNASTRFTDGFELGLGGELGISTQKLHVRGPVGLRELTTPRWIIDGEGQIR